MTVRAEHAGGTNVRLIVTQGEVIVSVVEEHEDLRRFWHDLGAVLNVTNELERQSQEASNGTQ
jgi:hypothetical protein